MDLRSYVELIIMQHNKHFLILSPFKIEMEGKMKH